jgi:predicted site-specific integrase-resolvase
MIQNGARMFDMPRKRQRIERLTSTQVASTLGVTRQTLHNWIKSGKIACPDADVSKGYFRWTALEVESLRMAFNRKESL